jgi:hypothetical protein
VLTVNGALSFAGNAGASSQQRTLAAANVGAGARITLAPPASPAAPLVLSSGTFSFAETTGAIDIANNALIDDYASSNPIADIRTAIARGYNGGAWNGNGITSSHAAAIAADPSSLHKTAIGFADASTLSVSSFAGQTVDQSSVLVRYTFAADANLDGAVNSADFDALAGHFNSAAPLWSSGDFNFDGTVNALDFNFLATNFGSALSSVPLGTVVPEPSAALIASAAILLVRSRQRNCRPRKWRDR